MILLIIICQFLLKNDVVNEAFSTTIHLKDQCTGLVLPARYSTLKKDGFYIADSYGKFTLPCIGDYKLFILNYEFVLTYTVSTQKADTLNLPKIEFLYEPTTESRYSGYYNCGVLANGKLVDYYQRKKKRLEGIFRKGELLGRLKKYDLNGQLISPNPRL